jgi:hypothetical protein
MNLENNNNTERVFALNPIPPFYPQGLPLYWRDEQSGQLSAAIWRYLNFVTKKVSTPPTEAQIWLIRCYLEHFIMAPCWAEDQDGLLLKLRDEIKTLDSCKSVDAWLRKASEIALDPI